MMTRCSNCGLPLSPTRTHTQCPRCGSPLANPASQGLNAGATPQPWGMSAPTGQGGSNGLQASPNNPWAQSTQAASSPGAPPSAWNQGGPPPQPPMAPPGGQPQQPLWLANAAPVQTQPPAWSQQPERPFPTRPTPPASRGNRGFIVAGVLVLLAALILGFVWMMASVLNTSKGNTTATNSQTPTLTQPASAATATVASTPVNTPTTTDTTPTSNLPGKQYIDNAQMASSVNKSTGTPSQTTTTFKPNQEIYVTFSLHPNGAAGAVCIYWYLNDKSVTNFSFATKPYSKSGYSYAIYGQTGSAYVDLYWASSTKCSDKVQAQHVTFTVGSN